MAVKTLTINNFTGGRNTKLADNIIASNESGSQTGTWAENGALLKMRGCSGVYPKITGSVADYPYIIKMVLTNLGASGANRLVSLARLFIGQAYSSFLVYTDNGTSFSYCQGTFGASTAFSGGTVPFMGMFRGKLYVSDGVNSVVSYDGTTVATVAAFPKYTACATHKNYMFAAYGGTVNWCDLNDATTWPANNFQVIDSEEGDDVVALKSWGGNLVILKRRSIYLLVGDTFDPIEGNYYLQKIEVPSGFNFKYPESVVIHNGVLKLLATDGVYQYSGGSSVIKVSDVIQPDVDTMDSTSAWTIATKTPDPKETPRAYVYKSKAYFQFISSGHRKLIVLDENNKWWLHQDADSYSANYDTLSSNFCAVSCDLGSGEKLYGALSSMPVFFTMDTGYNFDASAYVVSVDLPISASWYSKNFLFPTECAFLYAEVALKKQSSGTLTAGFSIDGATAVTKSVPMSTGTGTILRKRYPIQRTGRGIKFSLANAESDVPMEIYSVTLFYEPTLGLRL